MSAGKSWDAIFRVDAGFEFASRCLEEGVARGLTWKGFLGTNLVGSPPAFAARQGIGF